MNITRQMLRGGSPKPTEQPARVFDIKESAR
jgi:hypothetical protein